MRLRRAAVVSVVAFAALAISTGAFAGEPSKEAEAKLDEGDRAMKDRRFKDALAAYREAVAIAPDAPAARIAKARADDLATHAEGDFVPLTKLERARHDRDDRAVVDELARDLEAFPDGPVRSEARVVVAEAYSSRFKDLQRASVELEAANADPFASRATKVLAVSELASLADVTGDFPAAVRAVDRDPTLLPELRQSVHQRARRPALRIAAIAVAVVVLALAAWSMKKVDRKLEVVQRGAMLVAIALGGVGAWLAYRVHETPLPFLLLALAAALVHVAATAMRKAAILPRPVRALASVLAILALTFLILDRTMPDALASIGF